MKRSGSADRTGASENWRISSSSDRKPTSGSATDGRTAAIAAKTCKTDGRTSVIGERMSATAGRIAGTRSTMEGDVIGWRMFATGERMCGTAVKIDGIIEKMSVTGARIEGT